MSVGLGRLLVGSSRFLVAALLGITVWAGVTGGAGVPCGLWALEGVDIISRLQRGPVAQVVRARS